MCVIRKYEDEAEKIEYALKTYMRDMLKIRDFIICWLNNLFVFIFGLETK